MELNPLLMNAEDLLRYGNPKTDLELALFETLQEYVSRISLDEVDEYEELKAQVVDLKSELYDSEVEIESLNQRIEDLTEQLDNT